MARYDAILAYLEKTMRLTAAQAAGVLGNMQVESNFNPLANNPNEHAIGLCQWEGGRRVNLQKYAASHGGKETDLAIQLGWLNYEINHSYKWVLDNIRKLKDPALVAAEFDAHYEVSSGEARGLREANARAIYKLISQAPTPAPPTTHPETRKYTVRKGDTLWNIARRYYADGSKWTRIATVNHLAHPNLIYPGMVLTIP